MKIDPIPGTVREFLTSNIATLDDLSVLVVLLEGEARWWDAATVAVQTGLSASEVRIVFDAFVRRNLLDVRISNEIRYQLRPGTEDLVNATHAIAAEYRRAPARIVQAVAHRPGRGVSDFADAFRLKRR